MAVDNIVPYYDEGGITIYNADCRDVLPAIAPDSVALLLTDPPYGISMETDYGRATKFSSGGRGRNYDPVHGDTEAFDPGTLLHYERAVLFGANHYHHLLPPGGRWLVWYKRDGVLSAGELAWHNCGGRPVEVFDYGIKRTKTTDGVLHPTQKPASIMRWIVEKWTKPGDLVLDPFMGSGPVAQACADLGRRYVGVEIVEDYCRTAVDRLRQGTLSLEGA